MELAAVYVQVYGQLGDFFAKIQQGQAPDQFTRQHLVDLGFASSNHRALIPLMKALGFLTPDGVPTPRYHEYRSKPQARRVMGEALREAYGDLFVIKEHPPDADKTRIEGNFKSARNVSDRLAQLMASTFAALLALADLAAKGPSPKHTEAERPKPEKKPEKESASPVTTPGTAQPPPGPTLHYNIQIHLPATKDIEVFNAIFKSLKEHLLER